MTATIAAFFSRYPEVGAVLAYLAAVAAHVAVGALVHLFRLHDFDWHKLGAFIEQDFATRRGLAIGSTFVLTLMTTIAPGADWSVAFIPAFAALAAACAAGTLPVVRDTLRELLQLVSGQEPPPTTSASPPVVVAAVAPPLLSVPAVPPATFSSGGAAEVTRSGDAQPPVT